MAKTEINYEQERLLLEERKIKALEKLASAVDSLTLWFEEIEKGEWDERAQWYLAEFLKASQDKNEDSE
jgi:hypothetical protein